MTDKTAAKPKKLSLAARLMKDVQLWKTPYDVTYVDFIYEGQRYSVPVRSATFRGFVYSWCADQDWFPPEKTVNDCIAMLAGLAGMSKVVYTPAMRMTEIDGALYYDMADQHGRAVLFKEGEWRYVLGPPVRFMRGNGILAQAEAVQTDRHIYDLLGRFINCSRRDLVLIVSWLVGAMKPDGPYPVLIINGEQGSAKSTTTRVLARLIDPHSREIREPPTNARDFVAAVRNSYVLAFDNVSRIPHWFSDTLCRLATGTGAIGGRQLYTDMDEVAFMAVRPVILNGIPAFVERSDLADRTVNVSLPAIAPELRRDDDTFWAEFAVAKPEILGALYSIVARAHRDFGTTTIAQPPRMANFARWVCAGLGEGSGEFLDILMEDRKEQAENALEHEHVAQALLQLLNEHVSGYVGTLHSLLLKLEIWAPRDKTFWPSTPLQLFNAIKRINPSLRKAGILWEKQGREPGTGRSVVSIRRADNWHELGFAVSAKDVA